MTGVILRGRVGKGGDLHGLTHPRKIGQDPNKFYLPYILYVMKHQGVEVWNDK